MAVLKEFIETTETVTKVDISLIDDNPYNPRSYFPPDAVKELSGSIEQHGLRQIPEAREAGGRYQLAYGHMRKRAFKKLNEAKPDAWKSMPLKIREITDADMFYFAMEENLKRTDIRPLEVATCINSYLRVFPEMTEVEVGKKLNMTQGNISNMRRVLTLPKEVLDKINEGVINFTQGRELLVLKGLKGRGGSHKHYSNKEDRYIEIPEDEAFLMKAALSYLTTNSYEKVANTVDGIKKAIDRVASHNFDPLDKTTRMYVSGEDILFDSREAGCLKCEHCLKTNETKTQVRHWCTNHKCWQKKQQDHKDKAAKEARAAMEREVVRAAAAAEVEPAAEDEAPAAVIEDGGTPVEVNQKPEAKPDKKIKVTEALKAKYKNELGTRAEVLDIREFKQYEYSSELKTGYADITGFMHGNTTSGWGKTIGIDNPDECLKTCIKGFHFAFDSEHPDRKMIYVCSDTKCLARKKAAFTRALNAAGQARKDAENKAIKQAVESTTHLDRPRLKAIILHLMQNTGYSYSSTGAIAWWYKAMGLEKGNAETDVSFQSSDKQMAAVFKELDKRSEAAIAQFLIRFVLVRSQYGGDVVDYQIRTRPMLKWMGVKIEAEDDPKRPNRREDFYEEDDIAEEPDDVAVEV